jgi:hypothetical protein
MTDQPSTIGIPPLLRLAAGFWLSQALFVAAKLGLADELAQRARSAAELADAVGAHPEALHRILRALAGTGLFTEDAEGRFGLTPHSHFLCRDAPTSLRDYMLMFGSDWSWRAWGELEHSVRTGKAAVEHALGQSLFEHLAAHPKHAQVFDAAMVSRGQRQDTAVAAAYDWPASGTIVDVGGGRGSLIAAVLARVPRCRGVLFDLPHVVPAAAKLLDEAGLAARCEVVAGDFFERVPDGAELYLLKQVIHDWDDERACAILDNCRKAMSPQARLLVLEYVLIPDNELSWAKLLDLQMLVLTPGGRERSEAEYRALLASVGLTLQRIIPTDAGISVIEAKPD